jgi:multidrug efflux pump subunit AcrA (membrane-fusion protein)
MRRNPRRLGLIILVVAVFGGAYWLQQATTVSQVLGFVGTIEATDIHLASQIGGWVKAVHVTQGDHVQAGQDLIDIYSSASNANEEITSPIDGIVLLRLVEPGELAAAGSNLIILANTEDLTLTVYMTEDRYGQIVLGQTYPVTVDAFPGQTFTGKVSHIADQAAFTTRNVQTVEKRKTTMYAITLSLTSANGKLKPGMPAEVLFEVQ